MDKKVKVNFVFTSSSKTHLTSISPIHAAGRTLPFKFQNQSSIENSIYAATTAHKQGSASRWGIVGALVKGGLEETEVNLQFDTTLMPRQVCVEECRIAFLSDNYPDNIVS